MTRRADDRMRALRIEVEPHNCFACGELNVHGLHLVLHVTSDGCWTDLSLPERFEGWQGIAHGGIVCTILDEVMAWALVDRDAWGLTARMSVDFKRPVRIGVPIRAEGRVTGTRRRVLRTAARVVDLASGEELATGEATYVAAPEHRKRELKERYRFRAVPELADTTPRPAEMPEAVAGGAVPNRLGTDR
jgi:acyl-CoA hydrolase